MKNLLLPILIMALTVGFGCKNIFQEQSIVGNWVLMKAFDPKENKWSEKPPDDKSYVQVFKNGNIKFDTSKGTDATYKLDNSASPKRLLITINDKPQIWIYKFQGERLIVKMFAKPENGKNEVAKDFNTEPNFAIWELEKK